MSRLWFSALESRIPANSGPAVVAAVRGSTGSRWFCSPNHHLPAQARCVATPVPRRGFPTYGPVSHASQLRRQLALLHDTPLPPRARTFASAPEHSQLRGCIISAMVCILFIIYTGRYQRTAEIEARELWTLGAPASMVQCTYILLPTIGASPAEPHDFAWYPPLTSESQTSSHGMAEASASSMVERSPP
jgi:hypothetical protein